MPRYRALIAFALLVPRTASAVEGGTLDTVTTHAVAIAAGGPSSPSVRCSGTLVSPNVVLTVRHCLAAFDAAAACSAVFAPATGVPDDLWVDASPFSEPSTSWKNVASWVLPTDPAVCGNDIALLLLKDPFAPSEATPARVVMAADAFHDAVASRLLGLSGFGGDDGDARGERRARFDIPILCVPDDSSFPCASREYLASTELASGDGPCVGDSGAGAMTVADHGLVFGVLSRGNLDGGTCGSGVFERTDVWAWLIASTVISATPPGERAPDWATALFPAAPKEGELCRADTDCGDGSACVSLDADRSYVCAPRCDASGSCAEGRACESGVCVAAAASDHGCAVGKNAPGDATALVLLAPLLCLKKSRRRAIAKERERCHVARRRCRTGDRRS